MAAYRVRVSDRERDRSPVSQEKSSKSRGDYATKIREQHDGSKPIETKYFKFDC